MERAAGTFQGRLVTELRLADVSSIGESNSVLEQFLPRFNRRFRVPPKYPEPAFRPLDPALCLEQILCFKHSRRVDKDNTVRFQLHTPQLLPGPEGPCYAGAVAEYWKDWTAGCRCGMKTHRRCPGGAHQSGISPKRPPAFRNCSCPGPRRQRLGRTLDSGSQTTGLEGNGRGRSIGHPRKRNRSRDVRNRLCAQADVPSE